VNLEEEERPPLEAVTEQWLLIVIFGVCNEVSLS
jgi:hypothetical protein